MTAQKDITKETFTTWEELDALVGLVGPGDVVAVTVEQLKLIAELYADYLAAAKP